MEYTEKSDNIERVYLIHFDTKKLTDLIDRIVKNTSYSEKGEFIVLNNSYLDFDKKILSLGIELPNGDPMYKDITGLYDYKPSNERIRYGHLLLVQGTKINVPELADIIKNMMEGDEGSFNDFLLYEQSDELTCIDDKIVFLSDVIDHIDNSNSDLKINLLNKLKKLTSDKKAFKYYNTEVLKELYSEAFSYISLQLISEKVTMKSKKILLRDYFNN